MSVQRCNPFPWVSPLTARDLLAKKQRVVDGIKILLDVAKESADWFPPLKSALGGVNALIKHYEVSVEWMQMILMRWLTRAAAAIRRCQGKDQGSYPASNQVQTERERDDQGWRRRGEEPALRAVQVRSQITCPAALTNDFTGHWKRLRSGHKH